MEYPQGPREWMPGPKDWNVFEIGLGGRVFLDGKDIGWVGRPTFRMTSEMRDLIHLWDEVYSISYAAHSVDVPIYPVLGYLHKGEPGRLDIFIRWESNWIEKEIKGLVHDLMDAGYRVAFENPRMWVGVHSLAEYKKAVKKIWALAQKHEIQMKLPIDAELTRGIVDMIARTLFVNAWADKQEEKGVTYPGQELFSVAPKTSKVAKDKAHELVKDTEDMNGKTLYALYHQALKHAQLGDSERNAEEFGYLLAMEALGHGVGLEDEFPKHGIEVPNMDFVL